MKTLSEKALFQRINRKLKKDWEVIRRTRPGRWRTVFGVYYTINFRYNTIVARDVDLEELANKLGVV
jgi:hypothetical protein